MTVGCVAAQRASLRLVPRSAEEIAEQVSFCSHCAVRVREIDSSARVCACCGLGLIIRAGAELAPEHDGAFIVLDGSMSICAVSRTAEQLLETDETHAVNRHVTSVLSPADIGSCGASRLGMAVARAIRGGGGPCEVVVRPANTFGVRLTATIGRCGPPPAALLVLECCRQRSDPAGRPIAWVPAG
jgi:hypothetical protein